MRFLFCLIATLFLFPFAAWGNRVNLEGNYFHYACDPVSGVKVTYRPLTVKEDAKLTNTWSLRDLSDFENWKSKHIYTTCKTKDGPSFKVDITAKPYNISGPDYNGRCGMAWFAYVTITRDDGAIAFDSSVEDTSCSRNKTPVIEEIQANKFGVSVDHVTHEVTHKYWENGKLVNGFESSISAREFAAPLSARILHNNGH